MLIKVFGLWLMAVNINYLEPYLEDKCLVRTNLSEYGRNSFIIKRPCDEVAAEINRQIPPVAKE